MTRALVLFDVDGTLLLSGGASTRAIHRACQSLIGSRFTPCQMTSGLLDHQIFVELARHHGIDNCLPKLPQYRDAYLHELRNDLAERNRGKALPGIKQLLELLAQREDVIVGLLTGNYREGAALKLAAVDLPLSAFAVGAYAEDGDIRTDLVAVACAQATKINGAPIDAKQVIIVGDTPRDIECARATGCHCLAVATGHFALAVLRSSLPDVAVPDLQDPAPLLQLIDRIVRD